MDSAIWCRTPAPASAVRRLRPEVSKNSSTALSLNEGELARSIATCVPAMACLSPSPVMVLTPVLGEAATTSWLPWRRMATVFEPMRPVPPMTTIFMVYPPLSMRRGISNAIVPQSRWECTPWHATRGEAERSAILILKRHTSHNTSCGFFLRAPASRLLWKRPRLPRSQGAAPQRSRTAAAGTPGLPSGDLGEPPDPLDTPRLAAHTAGSHTIQGDTPR